VVVHGDEAEEMVVRLGDRLAWPVPVHGAEPGALPESALESLIEQVRAVRGVAADGVGVA
jgi:hypothetical protein